MMMMMDDGAMVSPYSKDLSIFCVEGIGYIRLQKTLVPVSHPLAIAFNDKISNV
jgi:hypothetical protein